MSTHKLNTLGFILYQSIVLQALAIFFIAQVNLVQAQSCQGELTEAENSYRVGNLVEAIESINLCISNPSVTTEILMQAYRLKALSYIGLRSESDAIQAARTFLSYNPKYIPDPVFDPPIFVRLLSDLRGEEFLLKLEKREAIKRSLLFPGRGQYFKQQKGKGSFFAISAGVAIGTSITTAALGRRYKLDTDIARLKYERSVVLESLEPEQELLNAEYTEWRSTFNRGKTAKNITLIAAAATAVIWVINVIDSGTGFSEDEDIVEVSLWSNGSSNRVTSMNELFTNQQLYGVSVSINL